MKIKANRIDITLEDSAKGRGDAALALPCVLLIMGLGMQLTAWPPELVRGLVDAGYRVVRFDNRDIGLSQHFDHLGVPNLLWQGIKYRLNLPIKPPYSLSDMARDALGVLDALQIDKAHVVGVSMGGMIAQRVALLAPDRALSLTSIMSSSGARNLPAAAPHVTRAMLSRPKGQSLEAVVAHSVKLFQTIGSPGRPGHGLTPLESDLRQRVTVAMQRNYHPAGISRQMVALVADGERADALAGVTSPTLVLHGRADPLVPFACGEDTARRIPGAKLVGIDGMGHDLPAAAVTQILPHLTAHFAAAAPLHQPTDTQATQATQAT